MRKHMIWITMCMVFVLFGAYQYKHMTENAPTFSGAALTYGFQGKDVTELQGRLKFLGFYYGNVDGIFGSKTMDSVKWFQSEFGITVDGIVGPKTRDKLVKATKNWKPETAPSGKPKTAPSGKPSNVSGSNPMGLSANDLKIMANAVYGEARGEPYEGQVAVAAVILNRVKSPSFPNTVSGVIFQPGAFTAVDDGQIWLEPNEQARQAVQDALNGWDPSGGCLYYFNPVTATSKWIWTRPQVKTIGKHIFCM
ncbi:spore cortex-lytic enzyme [Paenibacillus thiaminolyticus]|uniref:spore cortex-lytic enzyme n=1 Tax=Paenibacillus thiaminolyticus TaxID=49283 RepID=UPI0013F656BD|nr:spore cortex-lytic enzyme [Paenibacillus thiaminolyticus]MDG0871093.1 spore cortex-lytic enzyme [Paenibacillus thiaminolyticus]NGP62629.1 spore cortex-lytic enzyme [Paenibacillus thiaminolyticus]WCF10340.1 spore cortex-lytic enzyme [Paenibacillus thiaminolyticus]WCR29018.1 spore cortex-lytic enzyme [Paenibacillus thiaminolyticus]